MSTAPTLTPLPPASPDYPEHVFLFALDVCGIPSRDTAREVAYKAMDAARAAINTAGLPDLPRYGPVEATWWHADADRTDRSDNELAEFVSSYDTPRLPGPLHRAILQATLPVMEGIYELLILDREALAYHDAARLTPEDVTADYELLCQRGLDALTDKYEGL